MFFSFISPHSYSLIYTCGIHTPLISSFFLVPLSRGAVLPVSQLWAEPGRGCQLQDYDRAPPALCMEVSHWGKNGLQPGTMDGGMNNGWRDGEAKHHCNLCLTKLKTCPGLHLWSSGPSHPGDSESQGSRVRKQRTTLISISFCALKPSGTSPSQRSPKVFVCYSLCRQPLIMIGIVYHLLGINVVAHFWLCERLLVWFSKFQPHKDNQERDVKLTAGVEFWHSIKC